MPRYDLVVNAIDALSNRIHGMSEDERRHQERMNAFGLTSARMGLEAERMRGQQAIQMEQAKRDKYLDEMTTLGEAVSSSKLPDAQKKIVLSQMSPEMRALPTTRRKAATSFFEAFKSRQKAQTEAAKRESDIKQKELDRASRERVAGINREARIEAAKVRTQKPTSELKRMEVNAWKAYLNGKATPRQEKLIGVDKDPNIGRAIELIKNDDTMYGKSVEEIATRAKEVAKQLGSEQVESKPSGHGKVVKTGIEKSTGKKVVQYEDGTLDYAD